MPQRKTFVRRNCSASGSVAEPILARMAGFAVLVDAFLPEYWRRNPVLATLAGVHGHDGDLGDLTRDGFAERDAFGGEWEPRFAALREAQLSASERIDREVLLAHLRGAIALQPFEAWARHAPLYPQTVSSGIHGLLIRDDVPPDARFAAIAARLSRAPAVLDAGRSNLDPSRTAPVHVVVAGEMAVAAATFVRGYLPSLAPEGPLKRDLLLTGQEAAAALERYASWLRDEFMATARGSFAIGPDALETLLRRQHLLDQNAASLVRLGRDVYEETASRLDALATKLGASSWQAVVEERKREHPSADELVDAYRTEIDHAREAVRAGDLMSFPAPDELESAETPAFLRPTMPLGAYFGPAPFARSRKGHFYVTPPDPNNPERERELRLRGHARAGIPVIAVHETYPGHHLQRARAASHPSAVRKAFSTPFFVEGWGLYCEELMSETGFLVDRTTQLFRLKDLLWRAARVIVDVGLSSGEMNFEQAVNFLVEGPRLERPTAIGEVRRHTLQPTQAMSYLVGRLAILRLRERARAKGWSLREFHDRLLATGSIAPSLAARELGL